MTTLDYTALAKQFWQNGYLVIESFFSEALMDEYDKLILEHFGFTPDFWHTDEFLNTTGVEVVPWFPQREGVKAFDQVSDDERLNKLTEAILGQDWYQQYSMVMFSKEGTKGQAWHQDCPPDDPEQFNMNRLIYTMDITETGTGGQTLVMPGSHKMGLLPASHEAFPDEKKVVLSPKKGSLVLLHGHCWHSVLPVTGKYRVSTNYRVAPKGTPENITDIGIYRNIRYQFSTERILEQRSE